MPLLPYKTITEHETLLEQKGYLDPMFGEPARIERWIADFRQRFEHCRLNTISEMKVSKANKYKYRHSAPPKSKGQFAIPAFAVSPDHLDKATFTFFYEYNAKNDSLSLMTVRAKLGDAKIVHFLRGREEPPPFNEIYEALQLKQGPRYHEKLLDKVQQEHDRNNDPFNDPHLDMNHPQFNQVNDLHKDPEYREYTPIDLSPFKTRSPRRKP